jgi:hypothetical protein
MYDYIGLGERWICDFGPFPRALLPKLGLMNTLPLQFLMMILALLHEQETRNRLSPSPNDLHPLLVAKDSGMPIAAIRFRMLQAMTASASCDLG